MIGSYGEFVTAHPSCSSVLYEIPFVAISLHRNLAQMSNRHVTTLFQPVLHPVKKVALPFHFYCEMVKTSRAKIGKVIMFKSSPRDEGDFLRIFNS